MGMVRMFIGIVGKKKRYEQWLKRVSDDPFVGI